MKNKGQEIVICKQEITDWKIAGKKTNTEIKDWKGSRNSKRLQEKTSAVLCCMLIMYMQPLLL